MSKPIEISSVEHFSTVLKESRLVVADFYANWCAPCNQIAPIYEQLSESLSDTNIIKFVKINIETEGGKSLAAEYAVTVLPSFILFRNGAVIKKVKGADLQQLQSIMDTLKKEDKSTDKGGNNEGSSGLAWRGADLPKGYSDISSAVNSRDVELLNSSHPASRLFAAHKPSASGESANEDEYDWVESEDDDQLILFMPFKAAVKLHTIQLTSLAPLELSDNEDSDDTRVMRPELVKLYVNTTDGLGFYAADEAEPTQQFTIGKDDWNQNGTVSLPLRFVRFQNITSLALYVVRGLGHDASFDETQKVRLDRVRLIGDVGEKREMGKLEKIGTETGETGH